MIRIGEISFNHRDVRKGQTPGEAEDEMGEMAKEFAEPEFEKLGKSGGVIPPKKRSVKRMMWDRAVSCLTASCFSSPPGACQTQKRKKKTVVPTPTKRVVPLPN